MKMNRLVNHFHPKMPLFLVSKLKDVKYGSEKYISWYLKFPDIQKSYKGTKNLNSRRDLAYIISCYYIWIFYLVSCVITLFSSYIIGVVAILFSPLIVSGYIYAIAYTEQEVRKILKKYARRMSSFQR